MRGSTSRFALRSLSQRAAWLLAASALSLTLGLGGCRAGAHNANNPPTTQQTQQTQSGSSSVTSGATSGATTGSSNAFSLQQLQSIDSQDQSDSQQLNSAQNNAGVNYSSQENNTLP